MLRRITLVLALALLKPLPAAAETAEKHAYFGGQTLTLPSPPGHCWVKDQHSFDVKMYEYLKSVQRGTGNKLLGYWMDCKSLKKSRAGQSKGAQKSWIIIIAPWTKGREGTYENVSRARYLSFMKNNLSKQGLRAIYKSNQKSIDDSISGANEKYLSNPKAVQIGKPLMLGILAVDEAVHIGMILKIGGTTSSQTVGAVGLTTLVKKVGIWVYHYREYQDKETIKVLLAKSKAYLSRLDKRNR